MADSKKPARPKGPRSGGKAGSGWSTSKPGTKSEGRSSGKSGAKGSGAGGEKKSGGFSKSPRREGDPRVTGGYGKPPRKKPAPEKKAPREHSRDAGRVDDFDFDMDMDLGDMAPAAFPKPARSAKNIAALNERPARPSRPQRPQNDDRPASRPDNRSDRAPRAEGSAEPEDGKSVTAGRNPVRELLESAPKRIDAVYVRKGQRDAKVQEIVALADENRIKVQFVDDVFLRRLHAGTHQGVVAVTAAVEYADLDTLIASVADAPLPVIVALDGVQDPGNMGAIARTAWALGAAGLIVPRHGGAYIGSGAMRASAGALHHLPVARVTNMSQALDACAEAGLSVLCADAEGENLYTATVRLPAVLVLGGEEKGVRHGVGKHCQQRLSIPLKRGFDSLNVGQAAAICLARLGQL